MFETVSVGGATGITFAGCKIKEKEHKAIVDCLRRKTLDLKDADSDGSTRHVDDTPGSMSSK